MVAIVAAGEYQFGAAAGRMLICTYRTGLGARAGHDLVIEVGSWQGSARIGSDATDSSVTVSVEADSFVVQEGRGGLKPFTGADRDEIRRTIRKILDTADHPEITFRSTAISGAPDDLNVVGELMIRAAAVPVTVTGSLEESADGPRLRATAQVVQSAWGIRPYTAFLGALKLRDAVDIEIEATLAPAGPPG
ncbi:MAG TPA: YceI family protein [Jatrophihabitans sp.]|nr:YceI family protein [Jatrophihabitans sp.]